MLEDLLLYYDHPVWPIFLVVISTFVLEDIAIIGAGFLAASEKMAPGLAFFAVCLGIFIGDTALYLLGRLALVWPWLRHKMRQPLIRRQMRPLQLSPWSQIMLIRCMPGIRTFGYIACGLARVHPVPFCLANVCLYCGVGCGSVFHYVVFRATVWRGAAWIYVVLVTGGLSVVLARPTSN